MKTLMRVFIIIACAGGILAKAIERSSIDIVIGAMYGWIIAATMWLEFEAWVTKQKNKP